jgi:hypothetical protein
MLSKRSFLVYILKLFVIRDMIASIHAVNAVPTRYTSHPNGPLSLTAFTVQRCRHLPRLLTLRGGDGSPDKLQPSRAVAAAATSEQEPLFNLLATDRRYRLLQEQSVAGWRDLGGGVTAGAECEDSAEAEATAAEAFAALSADAAAADPHEAELWANVTLTEYRRAAAATPGGVLDGDRCRRGRRPLHPRHRASVCQYTRVPLRTRAHEPLGGASSCPIVFAGHPPLTSPFTESCLLSPIAAGPG